MFASIAKYKSMVFQVTVKSLLLLCFINATVQNGLAQRFNSATPFPFYYYDYKLANPGLVGIENNHTIDLMYTGVPVKPSSSYGRTAQTLYGTYETNVSKLRGGIGGILNWQRQGPQNYLSANLLYSYELKLGAESEVRIGTQLRYQRLTINYDEFRISPDDPLIPETSKDSESNFDVDLGVVYHAPKLTAGVTLKNILQPAFDVGLTSKIKDKSEINILVARKFEINHWLDITPSVIIVSDFDRSFVDINSIFQIKKWVLVGVGYAFPENGRDDFSFNIGLNIGDTVQFITHLYSQSYADYSATYGTRFGAMLRVQIAKDYTTTQ